MRRLRKACWRFGRLVARLIIRAPRPGRRCIFCGQPANSKEHAWPAWLIAVLKKQSGQPVNISLEQDGQPWLRWHGPKGSIRVKAVCKSCNEGWMKALEDEAKPILEPLISDTPTTLSSRQQFILCHWVMKTAMIFDALRSPTAPHYQPVQTTFLFQMKGPPPSTFGVWLGRYYGEFNAYTTGNVLNGLDKNTGTPITGHVQTMSFGPLMLQALSMRHPAGQTITTHIDLDMKGGDWDRVTVRLWPIELKPCEWPPPLTQDDSKGGIAAFAERFQLGPSV